MPRCFFNIKDGETVLDEEGVELVDLAAIQHEALHSTAGMIQSMEGQHFWSGEPWELWVTDQPSGGGSRLFTLVLTARGAS